MKRLCTILLLTVFFLHFAGVYVYFVVKLSAIHREMKAQLQFLPEEQLEKIQLTRSEYESSKVDNHEVSLAGKMYDIARVEQRGDSVIVFAIHDEAEDNLLSFLDEVAVRSSRNTARAPSQVVQFTTLIFLMPLTTVLQNASAIIAPSATTYQFATITFVAEHETPPPKA